MKVLPIYDDAHKALKIEAAKSGKTLSSLGSQLILRGIEAMQEGKLATQNDLTPKAPESKSITG